MKTLYIFCYILDAICIAAAVWNIVTLRKIRKLRRK